MNDIRITLAFLWVALMLIYLLGDVLRIFAGDLTPGEIEGRKLTHRMVFVMAIIMVVPIIMVALTVVLEYSVIRWVNIIVAIFFFGFNLISIRGYANYDKFLLIVSMVFNLLTIFYAWNWVM